MIRQGTLLRISSQRPAAARKLCLGPGMECRSPIPLRNSTKQLNRHTREYNRSRVKSIQVSIIQKTTNSQALGEITFGLKVPEKFAINLEKSACNARTRS